MKVWVDGWMEMHGPLAPRGPPLLLSSSADPCLRLGCGSAAVWTETSKQPRGETLGPKKTAKQTESGQKAKLTWSRLGLVALEAREAAVAPCWLSGQQGAFTRH